MSKKICRLVLLSPLVMILSGSVVGLKADPRKHCWYLQNYCMYGGIMVPNCSIFEAPDAVDACNTQRILKKGVRVACEEGCSKAENLRTCSNIGGGGCVIISKNAPHQKLKLPKAH